MLNITNKAFLVSVDNDFIYVFHLDNLSVTSSFEAPLRFEGNSFSGCQKFIRTNKYMPITDKEIAELFAEGKEVTKEEEQQNEQNYYIT